MVCLFVFLGGLIVSCLVVWGLVGVLGWLFSCFLACFLACLLACLPSLTASQHHAWTALALARGHVHLITVDAVPVKQNMSQNQNLGR